MDQIIAEPKPLLIPASDGTFVLCTLRGADGKPVILQHVCTHFLQYPTHMIARGLVPLSPEAIEVAVLHPSGHVSSPSHGVTYPDVETYRNALIAGWPAPDIPPVHLQGGDPAKPKRTRKPRTPKPPEEDLIG